MLEAIGKEYDNYMCREEDSDLTDEEYEWTMYQELEELEKMIETLETMDWMDQEKITKQGLRLDESPCRRRHEIREMLTNEKGE